METKEKDPFSWGANIRTGFKDHVDLGAFILTIIATIVAIFGKVDISLAFGVVMVYVFNSIFRKGKYLNALDQFVEDERMRQYLQLPLRKKEEKEEKKVFDRLTYEVEIDFPEGKKSITMIEKAPYEIEDCEEGKVVCLHLRNNETHTGIFKGMDNDDDIIKLRSISGEYTLGYNVNWLENYLEEVKEN